MEMKPVPFESWRFGEYKDVVFIAVVVMLRELDGVCESKVN